MKKKLLVALLVMQVILLLHYFISPNKWATDRCKQVVGQSKESPALSDRSVTVFCEDGKHRMWIGTRDGLNIYSGTGFRQLTCIPTDTTTIPDNHIQSMACDSLGRMWIGTPNGVACHEGWYRFRRYTLPFSTTGIYQLADYGKRGMVAVNGKDAYIIKGEKVQLLHHFAEAATQSNYIVPDCLGGYWTVETNAIRHYNAQGTEDRPMSEVNANLAYISRQGDTLWVDKSRWLTGIDLRANKVFYQSGEQMPIIANAMCSKDTHTVYLCSSFHGLHQFDLRTRQLTKITDRDLHLRHKDATVSKLYRDSRHNIWVGYEDGGFQILSRHAISYEQYNNKPLNMNTAGQNVGCLAAVGTCVVGSTEDEVFCCDMPTGHMTAYHYKDIFCDSPYFRQTLSGVVPLGDDRAWLISNVRILSCRVADGRISTLCRVFGQHHYGPLLGNGCRVDDDVVVTSDSRYLLRSTFGSEQCDSIYVAAPMYGRDSKLVALPGHKVLVVMKGLNMCIYDAASDEVTPYDVHKVAALDNADPEAVFTDSRRRIWIGTRHHGLTRLDMSRGTLVPVADVPLNNITAMQEDTHGLLRICSHDNMLLYNPADRSIHFAHYASAIDDSDRSLYYRNSCRPAGSGVMVFGTTRGCLTIPLGTRSDVRQTLDIQLIDVFATDGTRMGLKSDYADGTHFTLPCDENRIAIGYGSTDYGEREKPMYQYKLDGYDRQWSDPTLSTQVQYSNLLPGTYTFRVRLVPTQHGAPAPERTVTITIRQRFWLSWAALFFYIVAIAVVVYRFQLMYLHGQRDKLRMEQLTNERLRDKRTNEMNMNFFANISHEFRNPLTLIAGPLLMLKSDEQLPRAARKTLNTVCLSVNRMLVLIDQMLDFNKLEADALRLGVAEHDAVSEIQTSVAACAETARLRSISVATECSVPNLYVWLDRDKLDKIMGNLLTNALKHTPDGGRIAVTVQEHSAVHAAAVGLPVEGDPSQRCLCVAVYNNGPHIDNDKLGDIFKRYYQAKGTQTAHQYGWGTGLGLYYVKRLVTLHHGQIKVVNEPEGGVSFVFALPADAAAYTDNERTAGGQGPMQIPTDDTADETEHKVQLNTTDVNGTVAKPTVLIVDDDTAVGQYVRSLFGDDYVVVNKYSAESALESIADIKPDIVLSDVIMGEMNGYDLCRRLKQDLMTCHIPVVLITAKSNVSEQVQGLDCGANAYVTKPFDPRYLKALVGSLLNNAALLRKKLGEGESAAVQPADGLAEQDRLFLDKLYELMEKHITDQSLNVATISKELLISHSKFNYKLKELTGETPGNLFRKFKLNKAARMLREGKHNVSEVAYTTGFGTVSYFSVAFKKQFGVSPSEYR